MKRYYFLALLLLLVLAACQNGQVSDESSDPIVSEISMRLKKQLDEYILADKNLHAQLTNQKEGEVNLVFMVDPQTGYTYTSEGSFFQFDVYKRDRNSVMRQQNGKFLDVQVFDSFTQTSEDISAQQLRPD